MPEEAFQGRMDEKVYAARGKVCAGNAQTGRKHGCGRHPAPTQRFQQPDAVIHCSDLSELL